MKQWQLLRRKGRHGRNSMANDYMCVRIYGQDDLICN